MAAGMCPLLKGVDESRVEGLSCIENRIVAVSVVEDMVRETR